MNYFPDDLQFKEDYEEYYREFNNSPFNVDEFYDSSFYDMTKSLNILILNEHIQHLSQMRGRIISKESFERNLTLWLKEEMITISNENLCFLRERLLTISALFLSSEIGKNKLSLLRIRDEFQEHIDKINKLKEEFRELKPVDNYLETEKRYKRHIKSVSAKGKNLKFLLEETLIIHSIKQITGLTFEQVCLLISKAYEFFLLLPSNTNPINYSHSLKTNIYQFVKRKKKNIYEFLELEKEVFNQEYKTNKIEIDNILIWVESITK